MVNVKRVVLSFVKLESENLHNFINKKLVISSFVANRFDSFVDIKKFIIRSAKIYGP